MHGLPHEQRPAYSGIHVLRGEQRKLLSDLHGDDCGLHPLSCRHLLSRLAFSYGGQRGLLALHRRKIWLHRHRAHC